MQGYNRNELRQALHGIIMSDGSIDSRAARLEFTTVHDEYADFVTELLTELTAKRPNVKERFHKKFRSRILRINTTNHPIFKDLRTKFYPSRKAITKYALSKITPISLAHMWMCDGYLEHNKNRKRGTVQNIGYLCFEAYPKDELVQLQKVLLVDLGISTTLTPVPWGFGYRLRFGGDALQILISQVYPHILTCFKYKAILFYKTEKYVLSLPNAEQYVEMYSTIEDIVRHPLKKGKT